MGKTLFEKIWDRHTVRQIDAGNAVLYIDRHYIHEVTSAQAFDTLRSRGLRLARPECTVATADHNVPTTDQHLPIREARSRQQVEALTRNCAEFGVALYGLGHPFQGIVHVIGPELGLTLPGMTVVCGDSHTATHGAFGTIAFGIGTSEVGMVFASQCLPQRRPRLMRININGVLQQGVVAKDLILHIIAKLSADGASGYFIEYAGSTIRSMSMEGRMTVCNMSIEMGARGGLVAPDETTYSYLKGRPFSPGGESFADAISAWKQLFSDHDAVFDAEIDIDAAHVSPMITFGTNPGMGCGVGGRIPALQAIAPRHQDSFQRSLRYMAFAEGSAMAGRKVDYVFIGSCTNARIEDLRQAAAILRGRRKAPGVEVWVVPGSRQVAAQAIAEGLDRVFEDAGIRMRQPGCSACLAMNDDKIPPGKYCVSTSNRNFEGRQGAGARTMLASPLTAAIAAITGEIADVRDFLRTETIFQ